MTVENISPVSSTDDTNKLYESLGLKKQGLNYDVFATAIEGYRNLDDKADAYEYCVIEFIDGILSLAGIDDEPTFTRSRILNVQEEVQTVISAGTYLESGYVTEKILNLLGDGDKAEDMIKEMDANEIRPLGSVTEEAEDEEIMNGETNNV